MASTVKRDVFYDCWGLVAAVGVGGGSCCKRWYGRIGEKDSTNSVVTCGLCVGAAWQEESDDPTGQ